MTKQNLWNNKWDNPMFVLMFNYDLWDKLPKRRRTPWYKRVIRRLTWILRGVV